MLPDDLGREYVVVDDLSAGGEATVAVVQHRASGHLKVVKIYRQGIVLPVAVGTKVNAADPRHVLPVTRSIYRGWATPRFVEVMDFVGAGSLEGLLAGSSQGVAHLAGAILVEMTDALDYVHTRLGLVHRDVKPANVLIRNREPLDLVLADLGIASELDEIRRSRRETSGGVKGTLVYQSPETLNSSDAGRPRDWWALGMTMCEVLTGQHPFKDSHGNPLRDEGRIRTAITMGQIDLSIVTDARWNLLCRGLLVHDPAERWGAAQVRQWLNGESPSVAAGRPSPAAARPAPGFRFAGQRFTSPVDLAAHMVTHWDNAADLFMSQSECEALRVWIRDDLHDMEIETNLLTPIGGSTAAVDARVIAFTTHYMGAQGVVFRGARVTPADLGQRFLQTGHDWERDPVLERLKPEVMAALVESQLDPDADQQGQSAEYHALLRLSRHAAEVDREIETAAAEVVRAVSVHVGDSDIGADVRNAMPRRVDRARAVARAALVSAPARSGIHAEFGQLDRRRPRWFADLCTRAGHGGSSGAVNPTGIGCTALAVGIADLAALYERARIDAEQAAERRRHDVAAAREEAQRRELRRERWRIGGIAAIGAVICIAGLIAHNWLVKAFATPEPDDWLNNAAYEIVHWPSAQTQNAALWVGIVVLVGLALMAAVPAVNIDILRVVVYCGCGYAAICVLPALIIAAGYALLVAVVIGMLILLMLGIGGAASG